MPLRRLRLLIHRRDGDAPHQRARAPDRRALGAVEITHHPTPTERQLAVQFVESTHQGEDGIARAGGARPVEPERRKAAAEHDSSMQKSHGGIRVVAQWACRAHGAIVLQQRHAILIQQSRDARAHSAFLS